MSYQAFQAEFEKRIVDLSSSAKKPYPTQVIGESSYRDNLEQICSNLYDEDEGYFADDHWAFLFLEDDNAYDPGNAVLVEIDNISVGYLSKTDATKFRKRLIELGAPNNAISICQASIKGGFRKKDGEIADFGVRLDFDLDNFEVEKSKPHVEQSTQKSSTSTTPIKKPIKSSDNLLSLFTMPSSLSAFFSKQVQLKNAIIAGLMIALVSCCCGGFIVGIILNLV